MEHVEDQPVPSLPHVLDDLPSSPPQLPSRLVQPQPPSLVNVLGAPQDEMIRSYIAEQNEYAHLNAFCQRSLTSNLFRVMTFNLHFWFDPFAEVKVAESVYKVIRETSADVLVLQEFNEIDKNVDCWREKIDRLSGLGMYSRVFWNFSVKFSERFPNCKYLS